MLIGVYHARNPRTALSKQRISALLDEARSQGVELIFFHDAGIHTECRCVSGFMFADGGWQQATTPYPAAVINDLPGDKSLRSDRETAMRHAVPFTTYRLHGKHFFTTVLLQSPVLSCFMVPTVVAEGVQSIDDMFVAYDRLILKPDNGRKGQGVCLVGRQEGGYVWTEGNAAWLYDRAGLERRAAQVINGRKYLIQPYITCVTSDGEPYDFRALLQRDGRGQWAVTVIYPRIGMRGTVTSNVAAGGRVEDAHDFIKRTFPGESAERIYEGLFRVSLAFAEEIGMLYDVPVNELGIDLTVDRDKRIWFYEANASPATRFAHRQRAVRTVEYARYLGLAYRPKPDETTALPGTRIGVLVSSKPSDAVLAALSIAAECRGADLVWFAPKHIELSGRRIRGFRREGANWKRGSFQCPDVVCNMLSVDERSRATADGAWRERLKGAAIVESEGGRSEFCADWWREAAAAPGLREAIAEHAEISCEFIDRHREVLLTSGHPEFADKPIRLTRTASGYLLSESRYAHELTVAQFMKLLPLLRQHGYTAAPWIPSVTREGHPFIVRIFLMKDGQGKWEIADTCPLIGISPARGASNRVHELPPVSGYETLLEELSGEKEAALQLDEQIREVSVRLAQWADEYRGGAACRHSQCCIDIGIAESARVRILDARRAWPVSLIHHPEVVRCTIAYALKLARERNAGAKAGVGT